LSFTAHGYIVHCSFILSQIELLDTGFRYCCHRHFAVKMDQNIPFSDFKKAKKWKRVRTYQATPLSDPKPESSHRLL